jgi:hypothetical protein
MRLYQMATHYIYCDSRDAAVANGVCDFTISLPENLELGPSTTYRIDQFRMVNALPNITNTNCYLYIRFPDSSVKVASLDQGYFSAQGLTQMMPKVLDRLVGGWGVSWDSQQNTLEIRNNSVTFRLLTDSELATGNYNAQINWGTDCNASQLQPNSFNAIIQNYVGSTVITDNHSHKVRFIDVQAYDYLTLRSKRLSSNRVTSARNEHDILLKIPIDVAYGNPITASTPNIDSLMIGRTLHKTLDFQLCDRLGNVLTTLFDPAISFTLVLYG